MTGKRSIFSAIAIALCFVLMLGATWALFEDSVANTGNVITTGDVEVAFTSGGASVEGDNGVFNCEGWTPGATAFKTFTVENVGDLAIDWYVEIEELDETKEATGKKLSDVVEVYYFEGTVTEMPDNAVALGTLADVAAEIAAGELAVDASATFTIALVLPEVADINDYQALSTTFSIVLNAAEQQ